MTTPEERERRLKRRKRNLIAKELKEKKFYSPKVIPNKKLKNKKFKDLDNTDDDI
jgi:hypothetical protein